METLTQDVFSKDLQIKILEEKLAFTQRQLEEKDKQLEHYKLLLKTMQELLNKQSIPLGEPKGTPVPPGFEQKYTIKGRKIHSFHVDPSHHILSDNDELDYGPEDYEEYEKDLVRRQKEETEAVSKSPASIRKSRSQTTLSQISNNQLSPLRSSTSSLPNLPKNKSPSTPNVGLSPLRGEGEWKNSKLKKSQSMTFVYSPLEENKLDQKFPTLNQMEGQIYQLSKYQQGCRFLQKKLEEESSSSSTILKELFDHLSELMTDPFGNYLFTKLVESCDEVQRNHLLQKILPDLTAVSLDMYGTQSLQKILPILNESQVDLIINVLRPEARNLIKHNKANYFIQYCLDKLSEKQNEWIFDSVCKNIEDISCDRVGCVIIKRCIDHANEQRENLLVSISEVSLILVQDPFGNYVVQHVLQKFPQLPESSKIIRTLCGSLNELCVQKFSSNVVEKCLKVADEETKNILLNEITNSEILPQLLNDRFANFVIQTALDVADPERRSKLVKVILPHLGKHYSPYTKRLQKKILQI